MDNSSDIEFNVDEQYENEKGVFTVISKDANEMVIRWENGEEIRTDIELQRRIIARRRREEAQRVLEAEAAANANRKGRAAEEKKPFSGLNPKDFKNSASGTRWRSRNQLGGAVVRHMVASGLGITILPLSAAESSLYSSDVLVTRPFTEPSPSRTVALAWRASFPRHKAIDALRKAIQMCRQ